MYIFFNKSVNNEFMLIIELNNAQSRHFAVIGFLAKFSITAKCYNWLIII